MKKNDVETIKNAIIQAEKHGVSDTYYIGEKGFIVSFNGENYTLKTGGLFSVTFKFSTEFLDFLRGFKE